MREAAPSYGRSGADESPICLPRRVAQLSKVTGNAARGETVSLDLVRLAVPTHPAVVRAACRLPQHLLGQTALSFSGLLRQSEGGVLSSPHGYTAPHGARDHRSTRRCWCRPGTSASRSRWPAFRLFQDAHGVPNHQQRQQQRDGLLDHHQEFGPRSDCRHIRRAERGGRRE